VQPEGEQTLGLMPERQALAPQMRARVHREPSGARRGQSFAPPSARPGRNPPRAAARAASNLDTLSRPGSAENSAHAVEFSKTVATLRRDGFSRRMCGTRTHSKLRARSGPVSIAPLMRRGKPARAFPQPRRRPERRRYAAAVGRRNQGALPAARSLAPGGRRQRESSPKVRSRPLVGVRARWCRG
jgi:hypothetical protein